MKKAVRLLAAAGAIVLSHLFANDSSAAICTNPYAFTLQGPASIAFDPALAVGATLWSGSVNASSGGSGGCSSGTFRIDFVGSKTYQGNNLYDSGISGIGYRLKFTSSGSCTKVWWPSSCTDSWSGTMGTHSLLVELVKTGPITTGGTLSGIFAEWKVGAEQYLRYSWRGSVTVKPVIPTCKVATPSIPVPLGTIPASKFSGVGSTSKSESFNIALQCSGGDAGRTTDIHLTLTDQTAPSNRTAVLSLTSGSTAQGLGIQVKSGTTLISYGPDSAAQDNPNRWYAGAAANGTFLIPLSASYVQTGATVKGGSANGRATFTMSYP